MGQYRIFTVIWRETMLVEQPGSIGSLRLKNRIVMAPMGTNYSTTDGMSTERDKQYYAERARGGVAMIMTEAMVVTEHARPHNNSLCCYHDRFIPGLASLVEAIKNHDCRVFGQLNHRGALLRRSVLNMEPVGPSAWTNPNTGDAVRALDIREIKEIQLQFVAAARRLWIAGYDGVEIHAANGYLFQQFFSPRINHRSDAYGGIIENRMRFLLETIDSIRNALPALHLIVRLSVREFANGGYSEAEIIELARAVEKAGVHALDLSGGSNESPQLSKHCIQPPSFPRAYLAGFAKPIRDAVTIPVLAAGRMVEPADAELMLSSGGADFVSLGRALYADPHWCLKAFGKIPAPIRQCIACNVCFERLTLEKDVACVTNPMIGTEFETLEYAEPQLFRKPGSARKRVMVIGAGIVGMEAARVLSGHGHEVEVWDKASRAGGQIHLAAAAPDKEEILPAWTYRWSTAANVIPTHLNVEITREIIEAYGPDFVMIATGSNPGPTPLDISRLAPSVRVLHAWDVLAALDGIPSGIHVTIVGGGMVGAEVADALRLKDITSHLIELRSDIARGMARNNRFELIERLAAHGTTILTDCAITDVDGNHMTIEIAGHAPSNIDIGQILIFATGPRPNREVVRIVEATGIPFATIGDCNIPGDFLSGLRDASMAALSLESYIAQDALKPAAVPAPTC